MTVSQLIISTLLSIAGLVFGIAMGWFIYLTVYEYTDQYISYSVYTAIAAICCLGLSTIVRNT